MNECKIVKKEGVILENLIDFIFDDINKYFGISNMPIVSSSYWNEVHGSKEEDVLLDEEGLQTMRNLGKNIAFLVNAINREKEINGLPNLEKGTFTSFIR